MKLKKIHFFPIFLGIDFKVSDVRYKFRPMYISWFPYVNFPYVLSS
jgi:hypothetical protein